MKLKTMVKYFMLGKAVSYNLLYLHLLELFEVEYFDVIMSTDIKTKLNDESRNNYFGYIPKDPGVFLNSLKEVKEKFGHRESFIDVGCGIADKTLLAHYTGIFDKCYGIECSSYTYDLAKSKVEPITGENTIIYGDAFAHDFSKYDTIYMYCPIRDEETMLRLLEYIYKTMREDAIIIFFNGSIYSPQDKFQSRGFKYTGKYSFILYKNSIEVFLTINHGGITVVNSRSTRPSMDTVTK